MYKIKIKDEKDKYLYCKYCNRNKKRNDMDENDVYAGISNEDIENWEKFKFIEERKMKKND